MTTPQIRTIKWISQLNLLQVPQRQYKVIVGPLIATMLFIASAAAQHPSNLFDRIRSLDRAALLIPNWRFFAPNPAIHDFTLVYRVLHIDQQSASWRTFSIPSHRRIWHIVWFPEHRHDKELFDVCSELMNLTDRSEHLDVATCEAWQSIKAFVESDIKHAYGGEQIIGCQFAICRGPGFEATTPSEVLYMSAYLPLPEQFWAESHPAQQCDDVGSSWSNPLPDP